VVFRAVVVVVAILAFAAVVPLATLLGERSASAVGVPAAEYEQALAACRASSDDRGVGRPTGVSVNGRSLLLDRKTKDGSHFRCEIIWDEGFVDSEISLSTISIQA
jgi:hypothetical protein